MIYDLFIGEPEEWLAQTGSGFTPNRKRLRLKHSARKRRDIRSELDGNEILDFKETSESKFLPSKTQMDDGEKSMRKFDDDVALVKSTQVAIVEQNKGHTEADVAQQQRANVGDVTSNARNSLATYHAPEVESNTAAGPGERRRDKRLAAFKEDIDKQQELGSFVEIKLKCRVEKDLYLDFDDYGQYTCVNCYNRVPQESFTYKLEYRRSQANASPTLHDQDGRQVWFNESETLIRSTFKNKSNFHKWQACCRHALNCCLENNHSLKAKINKKTGQLEDEPSPRAACPSTWDGLTCWPESPAGQVAVSVCHQHVYLLDYEPACAGYVSKQCFANGSWFIRNQHEWSDYSQCPNLPVHAKRLMISALWHIISALVITPALLTIDKFSNRVGNKRVKILKSLLFWLLVSNCISAVQKSAVVSGFFRRDTRIWLGAQPPNKSSNNEQSVPMTQAQQATNAPVTLQPQESAFQLVNQNDSSSDTSRPINATKSGSNSHDDDNDVASSSPVRSARSIRQDQRQPSRTELDHFNQVSPQSGTPAKLNTERHRRRRRHRHRKPLESGDSHLGTGTSKAETAAQVEGLSHLRSDKSSHSSALTSEARRLTSQSVQELATSRPTHRCRRQASSSSSTQRQPNPVARRQRYALVIFICWSLVVAVRTARLMSYSWMFTAAIYLCSALLFAPAEPPAAFIRALMICTMAFPILIALAYVTARTIVEPSPLNIIFKGPYYALIGDRESVDQLWKTQLECWFDQSQYDSIEHITDLPNMILICLNTALFVITLIILCRINRPGSTRQDMSPLTYFKAAGTLVVLYGGHYLLLLYRPNSESCFFDSIMFYSFLFVDGVQGIAVSYVFCYRTQEGKVIVKKYWRHKHEHIPFKWFYRYCCAINSDYKTKNNISTLSRTNNNNGNSSLRSNHSAKSNFSACDGLHEADTVGRQNETVTELINVNDISTASQF